MRPVDPRVSALPVCCSTSYCSTALTKPALRSRHRARRDAIAPATAEAWSDRIRDHVLALPEVAAASSLFVYASDEGEVQTYTLMEDLLAMGKTVAVPRIVDRAARTMEAVPIRSIKDLTPGAFGILAPPGKSPPLNGPPGLALVPGLAFDPAMGARLGLGGGYYDRYLAEHPKTLAVGLAFEMQLIADLPAEPHDQRVGILVTETRTLRITP